MVIHCKQQLHFYTNKEIDMLEDELEPEEPSAYLQVEEAVSIEQEQK